jgi:hypothetical protein
MIKVENDYIYDYKLKIPVLSFSGTVKLHGTNSAIQRYKKEYTYQSRNNIITIDKDNSGFATYMSNISLDELFDKISNNFEDDIIIYGEWIGPGIQKGCGIHLLDEKQFVIFGVKINNKYIQNNKKFCLQEYNIYNILDIPSYHIDIDFDRIDEASNKILEMVVQVDKECPWAKKFNCIGHGEGIVFTSDDDPTDTNLWFKSKGNSHKIKSKEKIIIEVDPIIQKSIDDFIKYSVHEDRLNQGLEYLIEQELDLELENLGSFLKWINKDINKEEYDVMEVSNLTWKQVAKAVTDKSKSWFISNINNNF